jgi:hypothetical protein
VLRLELKSAKHILVMILIKLIIFFVITAIYVGLFNYVYLVNSDSFDINNYLLATHRFSEFSAYWSSPAAWFTNSLAFWMLYEFINEFLFQGHGVYSLLLFSIVGFLLIARGFAISKSITLVSFFAIILLIIHPRFLDLALSQQRNFFALAILVTGLLIARRSLFLACLVLMLASFMHLSMLLFISLFFVYKIIERFKLNNFLLIFLATILSIFLIVVYIFAESMLGRQVLFVQSSYLYSIMWLSLTIFYLFIKGSAIRSEFGFIFYILILMQFLSMPFGGYSSRFVALAIPFLAISISHENIKSPMLLILIFIVWVLSFYFWINNQTHL